MPGTKGTPLSPGCAVLVGWQVPKASPTGTIVELSCSGKQPNKKERGFITSDWGRNGVAHRNWSCRALCGVGAMGSSKANSWMSAPLRSSSCVVGTSNPVHRKVASN